MKNREEYQASIFKKRDALLAKRRKKFSQAAAVMSIGVCFAVAFAFLPKKFGQKLSSEVFPVITDSTVYVAETYVEDFNEYYSFTSSYTPAIPEDGAACETEDKNRTKAAAAATKGTFDDLGIAATQKPLPNEEIEGEATTRNMFFGGGFRPEAWEDKYVPYGDNNVSPDYADGFTTEEITKKAKAYLSEEVNNSIIDKHNMVTVSRSANGSEIYTVWFYTDDKQIKVELNSENLELIRINEKPLTDTQATPAYITTTAAPAYLPQ